MSEIKFSCPACGQHIACDETYAGASLNCPACNQVLTIPHSPLLTAPNPAMAGPRSGASSPVSSVRRTPSVNKSSPQTTLAVVIGLVVVIAGGLGARMILREVKSVETASKPVVQESSAPTVEPDPSPVPTAPEPQVQPKIFPKAADFTLHDLDGNLVRLADHLGQVVILDFWATWCGPCRRSLPVLTEVANEYLIQGVVFYAVNLEETAGKVRAFQNASRLSFNVLLDTYGKVGQLYGATAIPRTVVIDQQGQIRAVHKGFSSQLGQQLRKELNSLLSKK